jgi:Ca-activated chloride channel family protein
MLRSLHILRWACGLLLLFLAAAPAAPAGAADAPRPAILVFDSSGSMAAVMPDGRVKLDAARQIVAQALASWPAGGELGVIAYGHRRAGDCSDIETILPLGPLSADAVTRALRPLMARGKTPLSRSLEAAAKLLPEGGGTIVLVSDGIETCDADPCAVAAALAAAHAELVIHVVGFGVKKDEVGQLACIAEKGNGKFFDAKDADGLTQALETVKVDAVVPPPPEPSAPAVETSTPPPVAVVEPPKVVRTHLSAVAGKLGAIVDAPVSWSVHDASGTSVYEGESRALVLDLLPGRYDVLASAANARGTRQIEVAPGQEQTFEVTVEAGRLDLSLAANADAPAYTDAEAQGVAWTLEPLDGQAPAAIASIARPSLLLAPGHYRVRAALQGLDAEDEVAVAAGEPVQLALTFRLGELVLEAALDEQAQPLDNAGLLGWRIGDGAAARTIEGQARPKVTLPEGKYPVALVVSGTTVTASAEVKAGEEKVVRVIVPGGMLTLSARLGPQSPPLEDWRDTFWTIAPIEAPGAAAPIEAQEPNPSIPLGAGRWHVTLKSGAALVEHDVSVAPGEPTALTLDVGGGRLTMNATPADDEAPDTNVVYAATAVDASGTPAPQPAFDAGSSEGASTILPAGRWLVTADDTDGHHAETRIELNAGEEKTLTLALN